MAKSGALMESIVGNLSTASHQFQSLTVCPADVPHEPSTVDGLTQGLAR